MKERKRAWYNEGNGFTLSFVSPLIRSFLNSLPLSVFLSPSLAIYRLETSYLRIFYEKKVWGAIPGERGREKSWRARRGKGLAREREGREQELTSEIVWTLLAVYFCELKAVEAQKTRGNWSKLVYLSPRSSPLLCLCSAILSLLKWNKMKWGEGWKRCIHGGLEMKREGKNWREARRHC